MRTFGAPNCSDAAAPGHVGLARHRQRGTLTKASRTERGAVVLSQETRGLSCSAPGARRLPSHSGALAVAGALAPGWRPWRRQRLAPAVPGTEPWRAPAGQRCGARLTLHGKGTESSSASPSSPQQSQTQNTGHSMLFYHLPCAILINFQLASWFMQNLLPL